MIGSSGQGKYRSLISPGVDSPLSSIPFHADGPIDRRLFAGSGVHPGARWHVAVHTVSGVEADPNRDYCVPHTHDCDELNVFLTTRTLTFRITLGDETYLVEAPASVHIPAGLKHSANVIEGAGFFVCIIDSRDYMDSLSRED